MRNPETNYRQSLSVDGEAYWFYSLAAVEEAAGGTVSRLPLTVKILLENLLRHEDGEIVTREDIETVAGWASIGGSKREVAFHPGRVLTHDSLGINMLQDLAALRDAVAGLGGDPDVINPLIKADLIVDHSVIIEAAGTADALAVNRRLEIERNAERYEFLKWAEQAFDNLSIVPPGNGICHQINLEHLATVVGTERRGEDRIVFPDTCLGTDSHTPMVNALGVLGWGVGSIEAEAAMLGQPVSLVLPEVVGVRLTGRLPPGATVTDLVLGLTERLRRHGVVGCFVEFFGPGVAALTVPDRATVANMAPEFGSNSALFPIDEETIAFLRLTDRDPALVALVERYAKAQGLWHDETAPEPLFNAVIDFSLDSVEAVLAGPSRPHERVRLGEAAQEFEADLPKLLPPDTEGVSPRVSSANGPLGHGSVVLAAITSCTNTSNPSSMVTAGLVARNAVARGLESKPWVKTSFTPGSTVVAAYLADAGLQGPLDRLGFQVAAFGCASCVGNSGPLSEPVTKAIKDGGLVTAAVLSGNRNFPGRVHPLTRANYLASPALVVAYALAGSMTVDLTSEPLGHDPGGEPVYLSDLWPAPRETAAVIAKHVRREDFHESYRRLSESSPEWEALHVAHDKLCPWNPKSAMLRRPPYLENAGLEPPPPADILAARPLAILPDMVNTDQISPAGVIPADSPAGRYLRAAGIPVEKLYTYPMRRGDPGVMARATFASPRLVNKMTPESEGGFTRHWPDGDVMTIFDAAAAYKKDGVAAIVIAGGNYGVGSSRDSAAKGPWLLGVRAVIAESFERIHRANLVGMGILPLAFPEGVQADSLGLDGSETYDLSGLASGFEPGQTVRCRIVRRAGSDVEIGLRACVETVLEVAYLHHGGILPYMLRRLAA